MKICSPDLREGETPLCSLVNVEYKLLLFHNVCLMSHIQTRNDERELTANAKN